MILQIAHQTENISIIFSKKRKNPNPKKTHIYTALERSESLFLII